MKGISRYNIVVGISIRIKMEDVHEDVLTAIRNSDGVMISEMFPDDDITGINVSTTFITNIYSESHQVTYDLVGKHKPSHDMIMECDSDDECVRKHFTRVIEKYLGDVKHEYQIFTLDTLLSEGTNAS